jgi:hypothetical protein
MFSRYGYSEKKEEGIKKKTKEMKRQEQKRNAAVRP